MPPTRRRILVQTSTLGGTALLAGCAGWNADTPTVPTLEITLENATKNAHVFHIAVETTYGLGPWVSREIPPETRELVEREPGVDYDSVVIHGVVDEQTTRGEVLDINGTNRTEICPRMIFRYNTDSDPTILQSSDVRC
ncbi:hypothetical protein [Halorubrum sp. Atlit-26R]|uniref:hypothetical protein n=1 Tax=Halorubrum sp. Atlit-26R TaxID=2282128 RepID=UPI0011C487E2|nr:hypothetical protein [Halorubrum sp. Atlit-26R]